MARHLPRAWSSSSASALRYARPELEFVVSDKADFQTTAAASGSIRQPVECVK